MIDYHTDMFAWESPANATRLTPLRMEVCDEKEEIMVFLKKHPKIIASIFLIFGIALVIAGIFRGEVAAVLGKATRICLECIGIG